MRQPILSLSIVSLAAVLGCKAPAVSGPAQPALSLTTSGLGFRDLVPGAGASPQPGQTCVIEGLGWVEEGGAKRVFLDTRKRGYPASFPLGVGRVIKGRDEGLVTMKKGGKRLLKVPPALGYSPAELGRDIPAGAIVFFELELIDIR